ncbi:hypothetical protein IW261DRAFT_908083 [Armillaria novae-zelandiae]|uniref:F-box domain-containing protein n=1 Tax=Armillaria novae-zelandiae TaxID=153914 RepID=A0AA39NT17_9AGAR|nr:hypothetical protein IW261DRAFT_908083 [Armillaria novae-zelandiae]
MDSGHKSLNSISHRRKTLAAKTARAEENSSTYSVRDTLITTYIPPELIDEIIDHLQDDKDALLMCSLVCRLFYPRTRVHLFRVVSITDTNRKVSLLYDSSSKNVLHYIQGIKLHWPTNYANRHASDFLPRFTTFLFSLTNLTSLYLSTIHLRDASHLHTIIYPLSRLTSLALNNVFFDSSESYTIPDHRTSVEPSPKIEAISMYGTSFHASIVDLITDRQDLRTIYVDSLRKLCIKYPPGEYLPSICTFLRATAGSLRRLDLYIRRTLYTPGRLSSWPTQLDRLPLTMQTLHIVIKCHERWGWHVKVMKWLLDSLSGPDGTIRLETMMLTIIPPYDHMGNNDYLQDEDWAAQWTSLDKALARLKSSTFHCLKVTFRPYVGDHSPWRGSYCKTWVERRLPLLLEQKFLEVDTVEYYDDFH